MVRAGGRLARGFTLVEAMLAFAVLAIAVGIAVPQYGDYVLRARVAAAIAQLDDLRARMERRYAERRSYAAPDGRCAIADFVDPATTFEFTCRLADLGHRYTWTATGMGPSTGFVYRIDESGVAATIALRAGWTTGPLPVNRFITRKGG